MSVEDPQPTEAQDKMLRMGIHETLAALGRMVRAAGVDCRESSYRRLGLNPNDGNLYYVVFCSETEGYLVRIRRDAAGSSGVMSCRAFQTMSGRNCATVRKFQ